MSASTYRDVTIEYQGQIVNGTIIRSRWLWHRVALPVRGGTYRLTWVNRGKVLRRENAA